MLYDMSMVNQPKIYCKSILSTHMHLGFRDVDARKQLHPVVQLFDDCPRSNKVRHNEVQDK